MTTREPMALDVFNDVEHLLRAVATGELSSALSSHQDGLPKGEGANLSEIN